MFSPETIAALEQHKRQIQEALDRQAAQASAKMTEEQRRRTDVHVRQINDALRTFNDSRNPREELSR